MKVFVYRKCSTCMKALKWLEAHNIEFEERAIKEENPTYEELKEWYTMSGLPLKKFFNTSGMIYKQMNLKDKLKEMTEDDQLKLLATDGMLGKIKFYLIIISSCIENLTDRKEDIYCIPGDFERSERNQEYNIYLLFCSIRIEQLRPND